MANSAIKVTELDFDTIRAGLKTYLKSHPVFLDYDFEGSTISMLVDLLAYNTYQNAFYASMVGNEMFLDSAILRNNVVSRAKALGYTPRSARGATTTVDVVITANDSPGTVTILKNTSFSATLDGEEFKFVTPQDYILSSSNTTFSGTITLKEGRPLTHRWTVSTSNPVRYIIPNPMVDTSSLAVKVQVSSADVNSSVYTLADDVTEVTANSKVYFLQENENQRYEIGFGDDVIGKKPINDNIVIAEYRVCNGSDLNGISSLTAPSALGGYSTFTANVQAATSGGSNAESISSIKFSAPKNFETQNRAVVAEDYERIILRDNGDIASVNVWGGEENTPAIFGKVFASVKPTGGNLISATRKDEIKESLKKYNVLSIDVEFVDAQFIYVRPTVKVRYNPNLTTLTATQIQSKVIDAIVDFENDKLGTFEGNRFRFSEFTRIIDNTDPSILSNITTIKMEKRFVPSTTKGATYNITFSNSIKSHESGGHTVHTGAHFVTDNIKSSAFTFGGKRCFLDDDGEGVIRIYYIEGSNNVVYLDETAGTIDYSSGLVTLVNFKPTAFEGDEFSIFAVPDVNDVDAVRNQILLIAGAGVSVINDDRKVVTATTVTATTQGVSTTTLDQGLYPTVF